ncbi:MAG: fatty acid desaturase [Gammaproteobacteria bacterium]
MHSAFTDKRGLAQFAIPNDRLAYSILALDLAIYLGLVMATVLVDSLLLKSIFGMLAGFFIAQLFVIGHDAGHSAFVRSRRANAIIARISFLPALHNLTLWQFVHNRLHHAFTNVKGYNSWSPLSYDEFQSLSCTRRWLERLYRSPAGLGIYYLRERWLRDKFFPRRHIPGKYHAGGWKDFYLNMLFLVSLVTGVCTLALFAGQSPWLAVVFAVIVPFVVWNYAMGLTTYQQHTHPQLSWYRDLAEYRKNVHNASEVSIYMRYASWYLLITHNCYVHPVHHLNARIPLYKLHKAQAAYMQTNPKQVHVFPFSLSLLLTTMQTCKLYDYSLHQWLDFHGKPTSPAIATKSDSASAEIIPLRKSSAS